MSTSPQSFEIEKLNDTEEYDFNIVLSTENTVRKILRVTGLKNPHKPDDAVKIVILHQRKSTLKQWEDVQAIKLNQLKAGEGVRLNLNSAETQALFKELQNIYKLAESGCLEPGEHNLVVGKAEEVIISDSSRVEYIKKLLDHDYGEEVWTYLSESKPDLATKLAFARMQIGRMAVLEEFKQKLETNIDEILWQKFFENNQWIFGYGLNYKFLTLITGQPSYDGAQYDGTGEQRGDFLFNSEAENKFTVLVEIKKPNSDIIEPGFNKTYRSGVWRLGKELLWATSQMQLNCQTWFRTGSIKDKARDELESQNIYTYCPRGILVFGHTNQLNDRDKAYTFEAYRSNLRNPEIITFDELYERAKFIVEHTASVNDYTRRNEQL